MDCYSRDVRQKSLPEQVRDYARRYYIDPARHRRDAVVQIVAGDVHKALRLKISVPVICNALSSKSFLEENKIALESREGPRSGLSTTARFTYRLLSEKGAALFLGFRGIAKQVFQALGGGEAFIHAERGQLDKASRGRQ
jgi:hypothetical protein